MSVRWRLLLLAVLLVGAGGAFAYRGYLSNERAKVLVAEWEVMEQQEAPLRKEVTLHFGREVTLGEWQQMFTQQTGLGFDADIDPDLVGPFGPFGPDTFDDLLKGKTRFKLDLPPMPALEALRTLALFHDIHWSQRSDGVIVWRRNPFPEPLIVRVYPLPLDLGVTPAEFQMVVSNNITPDQWEDVGGPCSIQLTEGALTIVQGFDHHLQTEQLLARLIAALKRIRHSTPAGLSEDDPIWTPVCLQADAAPLAELTTALNRPITLKANYAHWEDFAETLTKQARFPIVFHAPLNRNAPNDPNVAVEHVTGDLRGVPLRDLLREAGQKDILGLLPLAGGRMLFISPLQYGYTPGSHLLFAYPVADFELTADAQTGDDDLLDLITSIVDDDSWQDVGGPGSIVPLAGGKLLLVSQTLDNHRRLRELLAGLRAIRSGKGRSLAIEPEESPQSSPPETGAKLNAPCEFHFRETLVRDAVRNLCERTGVSFGAWELTLDLDKSPDQVWCHLPAAPLRENMQLLIDAIDHEHYTYDQIGELALPETDIVDDQNLFVTEIFDLRPRLLGHGELQVGRLVESILEPDIWADVGGPGRLDRFRNCQVVRCHPRTMARFRDLLAVLNEHVASREPKIWRGERIMGEALNRPLKYRFPADEVYQRRAALAVRDEQLRQRLKERVSIDLPEQNLGQAILEVAKRCELPVVLHGLPKGFDPARANVRLVAHDEPLGEVLQRLIGDPQQAIWRIYGGYLTVVAPHEEIPTENGFLYSVDDLLLPGGKLLPGQLIRTIEERLENTDGDIDGVYPENRVFPSAEASLHFGNLLWLRASPAQPGVALVEDILRRLRSGELKPLPKRPGDERYYSHPYRNPHFAVPEPVFGM